MQFTNRQMGEGKPKGTQVLSSVIFFIRFIRFNVQACWGKIPTSHMALKLRHRAAEQTTQRWVETATATDKSTNEISKIPTVTWLPPWYAKWQVLKFRLETSVFQIKDVSRVNDPTKEASWPDRWHIYASVKLNIMKKISTWSWWPLRWSTGSPAWTN